MTPLLVQQKRGQLISLGTTIHGQYNTRNWGCQFFKVGGGKYISMDIADWPYFVALTLLLGGFLVFVIWFLIHEGKKEANNEPLPPKAQEATQPKVIPPSYKNNISSRIIACEHCDGHYVERWKGSSIFVGCSNFPRNGCKSTLSIREFIKKNHRKMRCKYLRLGHGL